MFIKKNKFPASPSVTDEYVHAPNGLILKIEAKWLTSTRNRNFYKTKQYNAELK